MKNFGKLSLILGLTFEAALLGVTLWSCSTGSEHAVPEPTWIHQAARTVEGGYIIYVTSSQDRILEEATFKAKAAAIEDVANECSFPPKGTRVEDLYQNSAGVLRQVYVKMAVSFQDCEEAQRALDPHSIKELSNLALSEQLKRYQDTIDQEAIEEARADATDRNLDTGTVTSEHQVATSHYPPGYSPPPYSQYFVIRQQVAYAKETVILAPASAYPPQSPQSIRFTSSLRPVVRQAEQYRTANPESRNMSQSWSSLPYKPAVGSVQGIGGMRSSPAYQANSQRRMNSSMSRYRGSPRGGSTPGRPTRRKRRRF